MTTAGETSADTTTLSDAWVTRKSMSFAAARRVRASGRAIEVEAILPSTEHFDGLEELARGEAASRFRLAGPSS